MLFGIYGMVALKKVKAVNTVMSIGEILNMI